MTVNPTPTTLVLPEPDHIYEPETETWLMGNLPIIDGVIDGQGCLLQIDIASGLMIFTQPPPELVAAWASAQKAQDVVDAQRETDLATVRGAAASDPTLAALLRRLGIQ